MIAHTPRIGAVHALPASVDPTTAAFQQAWPQADIAHLVDGSLYLDRSRGSANEEEIAARIDRLIQYSAATGAEGIVFTGSFFGPAVRRARGSVNVPVATSFDGVINSAFELGQPLAVVSTATDSATFLAQELSNEATRRGLALSITHHVVIGALDALIAQDYDRHDHLIVQTVATLDPEYAVVIAQFSMQRALQKIAAATHAPVLGTASEGAKHLRQLVEGTRK